jgi:tetratricopeptide (TPR) repeat protein
VDALKTKIRRPRGASTQQILVRAVVVIVFVAAIAGALGWRTRTAAARLPALPNLSGRPAALVNQIEEADGLARRWPRRVAAVGSLGMTYHADLFYDQAIVAYLLAADLDPGEWRWPYYRSLVHMERGQLAQATDALNIVVRLRPDSSIAWWRLAESEFKQANYKEAGAAYARVQSFSGSDSEPNVSTYAQVGRARVAFNQGDRETAVTTLNAVVKTAPRFGLAHRVLADVYRADGRESDADRHAALGAGLRAYWAPPDPMVDALADLSKSSVFLLRLASSLDLANQAPRRTELVRRALESDEKNPDVVYEMGSLLQQLHRPNEALPIFTQHLEMVPDDQQTLVQIAKCYIDLGRLEEAQAALRKALALGDDAVGFHNLGVVLEGLDHPVEAEASYRRAVALGPNLAGARNNLGALLAARGQFDEAANFIREAIRLDPTEADAYANLSAVRLQQGRLDDAVRYARLAIDLEPRHANAHANLGVALARTGDLAGATQALEAALAIDPRHVNARRNLDAIRSR